ncbi:gamma-secretase subunit Aph-1-like [Rhipicephalus sanguineus]|uniref:gamma-secretase subunit Aph-1-like n=1 Tax=Rhipicephalus sanguineus TaxID=34632 RepID=UPI0020C3057D|nr:gamma-secretase subunit Aph-1-like [Rhipicephalus sanguineus]
MKKTQEKKIILPWLSSVVPGEPGTCCTSCLEADSWSSTGMTIVECAGYSLIAFGPSFAIFWVVVAGQPSRIVVFLVSSFFWLLSLLLSSVAWYMMRELFDAMFAAGVITSVCFQELFRYLALRTLRKAEKVLNVVDLVGSDFDEALFHYHATYACVSGFGFGATSAATAMLNVLADVADGPGTSH